MSVLRKIFLFALVLTASVAARAGEVEDSFARGHTAYAQGNYKTALREYRAALDWPGPHRGRAWYNVGVCHFQLAQLPEAVTAYRAALKDAPRYAAAAYGLGVALAEQGANQPALAALADAVNWSQGRHPAALLEWGTRLALAGEDVAAAAKLRQALDFAGPHEALAHNNLGVVLARNGFLAEAEEEFRAAAKKARRRSPVAAANLQLCRRLLQTRPAPVAAVF